MLALPGAAATRTITLHDGWTLQGKYKATVPATVMGTLAANGEYRNVLEGMAYKLIDRSRFDHPWTYRTLFRLSADDLRRHVFLQLDGVSWMANVRLNGTLVADTSQVYGSYRRHRLDITNVAKAENTLEIEVFRARKGVPNAGFADWNPRPADESMGLFRPVTVVTCGDVSLQNPSVWSEVSSTTPSEAWLHVQAVVENVSGHDVQGHLAGSFDGRTFSVPMTLKAGERRNVNLSADDIAALHVKNPRLWWCAGLGKPELYDMRIKFTANGTTCDSTSFKFGIREVGSDITSGGDRGFTLNGRRVLVRGGGWVDDIFMRDTPQSYLRQLEMVRDMNLNAIRMENIWGNSDDVFNQCDSLGIMVMPGWTCHWEWEEYLGKPCDETYGGMTTESDVRLMAEYLNDQVLWLRRHPAIICWMVGSDCLPTSALEQRYRFLLRRQDPSRPYVTSAKKLDSQLSGTAGMKMAGPYDYVGPSYWYSPDAPGGAYGFNSETSIGAQLPQPESIVRMLGGKRWPVDSVWNYHCTASTSSMSNLGRLQEVVEKRFGKATSFDDFVRKASLANYESTRAMFEAFRVNTPKATGIVQWMLNSARPSLYWQLYDHYGVPNAAYYSVRHAGEPLQLVYDYGDGKVKMVNETLTARQAEATMWFYDIDGRLIAQQRKTLEAGAQAVIEAFDMPQWKGVGFLFLQLSDYQGKEIASNQYAVADSMDTHDWENSDWYYTPISRYADFKPLQAMPQADVKVSVGKSDAGKGLLKITLDNRSDHVAFFLRLAIIDKDGHIAEPTWYSDNYLSLRPGESRTITCKMDNERKSVKDGAPKMLFVDGWNTKTAKIKL